MDSISLYTVQNCFSSPFECRKEKFRCGVTFHHKARCSRIFPERYYPPCVDGVRTTREGICTPIERQWICSVTTSIARRAENGIQSLRTGTLRMAMQSKRSDLGCTACPRRARTIVCRLNPVSDSKKASGICWSLCFMRAPAIPFKP